MLITAGFAAEASSGSALPRRKPIPRGNEWEMRQLARNSIGTELLGRMTRHSFNAGNALARKGSEGHPSSTSNGKKRGE
jgi:hypothetical protein